MVCFSKADLYLASLRLFGSAAARCLAVIHSAWTFFFLEKGAVSDYDPFAGLKERPALPLLSFSSSLPDGFCQ